MDALRGIRCLATSLATVGLLLPAHTLRAAEANGEPASNAAAALPAAAAPRILDVELDAAGTLTGRMIDGHGNGVGSQRIVAVQSEAVVAETSTDAAGGFQLTRLRGGVYQVNAQQASGTLRVWMPGTAPPGAVKQALLVADGTVVNGQFVPLKWWLADPVVIAGIVAVAAGVPIILHNVNQDDDSGS